MAEDDRLTRAIASAVARMDRTDETTARGALADDEAQILSLLGAAVVAQWNAMPRDVQRQLFECATKLGSPGADFDLRQDLALFLHDHHERTAQVNDRAHEDRGAQEY